MLDMHFREKAEEERLFQEIAAERAAAHIAGLALDDAGRGGGQADAQRRGVPGLRFGGRLAAEPILVSVKVGFGTPPPADCGRPRLPSPQRNNARKGL